MGLVNRVLPPAELLPAALAYAQAVATEVSPASARAAKAQLYADLHGDVGTAVGRAPRPCSSRWCGARTSPKGLPRGATGGCPTGPATGSDERAGCCAHPGALTGGRRHRRVHR